MFSIPNPQLSQKASRSPLRMRIQAHIKKWHLAIIISVAVFITFSPSLNNEFVNWDDNRYIVENRHYKGLTIKHLSWMFTSSLDTGLYMPLTWFTFGLDFVLWDMNPAGYHLTNLLFHMANSVILFFLIIAFDKNSQGDPQNRGYLTTWFGAMVGALFFALHPLRVESVTWITERRDVLSGFFYLLTVLAYLTIHTKNSHPQQIKRGWWICMFYFSMSLLAKPWGITLPVILMVMDFYPLERWRPGGKNIPRFIQTIITEKIPFFILSAGCIALTFIAQQTVGTLRTVEQYGIFSRLMQSVYGIAFYLYKTVFPRDLSPLYLLDHRFDPLGPSCLLSAGLCVLMTAFLYLFRRKWPIGLSCWLCYIMILAPVLGLVQSGPHIAADRYTYIACMPWAIVAAFGTISLLRSKRKMATPFVKRLFHAGACVVLICLAISANSQSRIWKDSYTLWQHTLRLDPANPTALINFGLAVVETGDMKRAENHYRQALKLNPASSEAYGNIGILMEQRGDPQAAIDYYAKALTLKPNQADLHYNIATALTKTGDLASAQNHFETAIRLKPDHALAHNNMGLLAVRQGRLKTAFTHFVTALEYMPELDQARTNASLLLEQAKKSGRLDASAGSDESISH